MFYQEERVMIFSSLNALKGKFEYPEAIQKAIDFMSTEDFKKLPVGRYEIEGDDIFALVQDQTTGSVSEKKAESHGNYIDIQFLMSGEEMQGYAPLTASAVGKQVEGKDNIFYDVVENEQFVHLKAGDFTIYFTNDIHRPNCTDSQSMNIHKAVIKVRESLIK